MSGYRNGMWCLFKRIMAYGKTVVWLYSFNFSNCFILIRVSKGLVPLMEMLGARQERSLNGNQSQGTIHTHLCHTEGQLRIANWRKLPQAQGDHAKPKITTQGPWSCEAAVQYCVVGISGSQNLPFAFLDDGHQAENLGPDIFITSNRFHRYS